MQILSVSWHLLSPITELCLHYVCVLSLLPLDNSCSKIKFNTRSNQLIKLVVAFSQKCHFGVLVAVVPEQCKNGRLRCWFLLSTYLLENCALHLLYFSKKDTSASDHAVVLIFVVTSQPFFAKFQPFCSTSPFSWFDSLTFSLTLTFLALFTLLKLILTLFQSSYVPIYLLFQTSLLSFKLKVL